MIVSNRSVFGRMHLGNLGEQTFLSRNLGTMEMLFTLVLNSANFPQKVV